MYVLTTLPDKLRLAIVAADVPAAPVARLLMAGATDKAIQKAIAKHKAHLDAVKELKRKQRGE